MRNKKIIILLCVIAALGAGLTAILFGYSEYLENHVEVDGVIYDVRTETLDFRGQNISYEKYQALQKALPDTEIFFDLKFQNNLYENTTEALTVTELSMKDLEDLTHFSCLKTISAEKCRDYDALLALQEKFPQLTVDWCLHFGDRQLPLNVDSLTVNPGEGTEEELITLLRYAENLQKVTLKNPTIPGLTLQNLKNQYPNVEMTWDQEYQGTVYSMDQESFDFTEMPPESVEELENFTDYFPNLQKVELMNCQLPNEEMAAYRERVRSRYQVIWDVEVGSTRLRTDETRYSPGNDGVKISNETIDNLRYCEDMIAVDLGHMNVGNTDWVAGTPHLKYLILGDGTVYNEEILPLSQLKELEWLEIFICPVTEVSCLKECTGLKNLLLSGCYVDVTPLAEMTWLQNLWLLRSGMNEEKTTFLKEHLPNTRIETVDTFEAHSRGWRQLPQYFEMRDALHLGYMS